MIVYKLWQNCASTRELGIVFNEPFCVNVWICVLINFHECKAKKKKNIKRVISLTYLHVIFLTAYIIIFNILQKVNVKLHYTDRPSTVSVHDRHSPRQTESCSRRWCLGWRSGCPSRSHSTRFWKCSACLRATRPLMWRKGRSEGGGEKNLRRVVFRIHFFFSLFWYFFLLETHSKFHCFALF